MPYLSENNALIGLIVDGVSYGSNWFSAEGGNLTTDVSKTRAGGMGDEVAVGGLSTRDDITLTIQLSDIVAGWHKRLENAVSDDAPASVGIQLLGRGRIPIDGASYVRNGIISAANLPDFSTDSGDVAFYTVVVALNQRAA